MVVGDAAAQSIPPLVDFLVRQGHRVKPIGFHQRVRAPLCPVDIEFFFEERINGAVKRERKTRRLRNAEAPVQVEAAGAVQEQIDF